MSEKQPRFRSPPFPYVGLEKALEKTEQLYSAVRHHAAALPTAANAWKTGTKSSATLQSVAALIQYGLLDDEGSGDARKVKLSPLALKIVMDKRAVSPERVAAIQEAALNPKTFAEIFEEFGAADGIDDSLLVHALTAERIQSGRAPYSEQSAADVIRIYRDTISFAEIGGPDKKSDETELDNDLRDLGLGEDGSSSDLKVGDFVQWISCGVDQFNVPKRIRALSDDGAWAFVDGSETGIRLKELEIKSAQEGQNEQAPPRLALPDKQAAVEEVPHSKNKEHMKVVWEGSLIRIEATIDKEGLAKLRKKLDAMETLLED